MASWSVAERPQVQGSRYVIVETFGLDLINSCSNRTMDLREFHHWPPRV